MRTVLLPALDAASSKVLRGCRTRTNFECLCVHRPTHTSQEQKYQSAGLVMDALAALATVAALEMAMGSQLWLAAINTKHDRETMTNLCKLSTLTPKA